jgi:CMP/dCMP kinase
MSQTVITVEGDTGAGKSTAALLASTALEFRFISVGAIFRSLGYRGLVAGVDPRNELACLEIAHTLHIVDTGLDIAVMADGEILGRDVLRRQPVSQMTAQMAKHPSVRIHLTAISRSLITPPGCVIEGRGIGTESQKQF